MVLLCIFFSFLLVIVKFSILICANSTERPIPSVAVEDYRLKDDIYPTHYNIDLKLAKHFYKEQNFTGSARIEIKTSNTVSENILINAKYIKLIKVEVYDKITKEQLLNETTPFEYISKFDRVLLSLKEKKNLTIENEYIIDIEYEGYLQDEMHGFYLNSYVNVNKQIEWLATTQFEAVHARESFPCFDEPNFKATFDIRIIHPQDYHALSNTNIKEKLLKGDMYQTSFERTPKMSTYIVAFTISKFENMSSFHEQTGNNTVWSRPAFINQGKYSLGVAPRIVQKMNDITGIPYNKSISKLDQIAIPDLFAEAMENWGLVTYRESSLLFDERSDTRSKQSIATVIAHELAHMWFGNLVTLDWWSYAWLNEGFAQYFEYFATHMVEDEWELDKQFVVEQHQSVLNDDALLTSHALTLEEDAVLTPKQIINRFDSITYSKGASVIRMMKHFMGKEHFLAGIRKYLSMNKQANTKPEDVWKAFNYQFDDTWPEDATLETVMKTWTEQAGFPVVSVELCNISNTLILNQERFFSHEVNKTRNNSENETGEVEEEKPPTWYIPISFTTSIKKEFDKTVPRFWLKPDDKDYKLQNVTTNETSWIILNIQSSAYMRVNYSQDLWKAIENALKRPLFDGIHLLNRAQIVDDAMNLARAGQIPYSTALNVTSYLEEETEYYPWYSALKTFEYILHRFGHVARVTKLLNIHLRNLMQTLHSTILNKSIKRSAHVDALKKALTLRWLCNLDEGNCVSKAQQLFKSFRDKDKKIEPDLQEIVYCTVLRKSNSVEDWHFLKSFLNQDRAFSEISAIISGLGCTRNPELLQTYLNYSVNSTLGLKKQDAKSIFNAIISGNHIEGPPIAFAFLQNNLEQIKESYGGTGALSSILIALSETFIHETQVYIFENFTKNADLGEASEAAKEALERCKENLQWVEKHSSELLEYLEDNVEVPATTTTEKVEVTGTSSAHPSTDDEVTYSTTSTETIKTTTGSNGGVPVVTMTSTILMFSFIGTIILLA